MLVLGDAAVGQAERETRRCAEPEPREPLEGFVDARAGERRRRPVVGARVARLAIGDAFALIPPFTGHGMAMAFQSAVTVVEPLVAWSGGRLDWEEATRRAHRGLSSRFRRRLFLARQIHCFLVERSLQPWLAGLSRAGLLPFRLLYRLLH